jgi:hypothetical protein
VIHLRGALVPTLTLAIGVGLGAVFAAPTVPAPTLPAFGDAPLVELPQFGDNPECTPTDQELRIACLPLMRQAASTLQEAEIKVEALTMKVREKETEVTRLEVAMSGTSVSREEIEDRLQLAKDELDRLQSALKEALTAREVIAATLTQTQAALDATRAELSDQKQQTRDALEDAAHQRWNVFISDTQLRLCSEGARDRMESCRSAVAAALAPLQRRYKDCVRAGEAVPELKASRADSTLPEFAERLDPTNAITRDWYVLFCDPSLPEARSGGGVKRQLNDPRFFRAGSAPEPTGAPATSEANAAP